MIAAIILWTYFAFITLAFGAAVVRLLRHLLQLQNDIILPFSILAILGLNAIAWLSSAFSLFLPISWLAHLLVLIGALVFGWSSRKEIQTSLSEEFNQKHWMYWAIVLIGGVATALYAVKTPSNPDTLLYHAQAIHWIEDFPVVPGLANLDPRLGSNSNWFVLNAMFSLSFLGLQSFHLVPSFLFMLCLVYFAGGLQKLLNGDLGLSQIVRFLFIPFVFYGLMDELSSPGTDLPVILLYLVILGIWIESIEDHRTSWLVQLIVLFLSVLLMTYKMSGVSVFLIGVWIFVNLFARKQFRLFWICIGIAGVILLPWLIRNFVLTGYWLYPEPLMRALSLSVDWIVPVERLISFKQAIQAWAISPGLEWEAIASLSFQSRLDIWFANLTIYEKSAWLLALFSPILFWIFYLSPLSVARRKSSPYLPVIVIAFMNLLFWLFAAPNFRFGYGFVVGLVVPALAAFVKFLLEGLPRYRRYLITIGILLLSLQQVYVMLDLRKDRAFYADYLVFPAPYPHAPSDPCKLGDQTILCARNWRQCGYDAFPCVPQAPRNVEMRGDRLSDGFHWKAPEQ